MIGRLLMTGVSSARAARELTGTHASLSSMRSFLYRGFGDAQAAQKPSILHVKVVSKPEAIGSSETLVSDFKKQKTLLTYHEDKRVLYILRGNHKAEGEQNASEQPTPTQDGGSNSAFSIVEAIMPRAKSLKATKIDVEIDGLEGKEQEDLEMLGLAFKLTNHKYEIKSDDKKKEWIVPDISIQGNQGKQAITSSNYSFYDTMGEFKNLARDYADGRPNLLNTLNFLEHAKAFAEASNGKVKLTAIVGEDLAKQGLNLHYAVGKASANPPVLINLTFMNDPSTTNVHAIVGKGITFDAGGLHIKPYGSMEDMFYDKAGASAAFATFQGAVELGLKVNLTCTLGMAENMVAANAYRPSDIIHSLKGLTVEIRNTDAEGRLVLADAMTWLEYTWTQKNVPNVVSLIEMSTLTGACLVALGERTAGLWTNDRDLAQGLKKASEKVREPLWEMPIYDDIRESLKGSHSDLVNISGARWAGSIVAAAFLENFVEKGVKWAHLDIAGPAHTNKPFSVYTKGCTGYGVGTLLEYYRTQAAK